MRKPCTEYGPKGEFLWGLKRADVERNAKVGEKDMNKPQNAS
jgi:hypothetical protein